jgi:hypothetical protein
MARHMKIQRYSRLKTSAAVLIMICGLGGGVIASQPASSDQLSSGAPVTTLAPRLTPSAIPASTSLTPIESVMTPTAQADPAPSRPIQVEIPSAQINYPVTELPPDSIIDMPSGGAMINPPFNPNYVYWMSAGGMPGEPVATYLTSHSSSDASEWPLDEISNPAVVKIGSPVLVTTAGGTFNYAVTELLSISRADFANGKYGVPPKEDIIVIASCNTLDLYEQTRVLVAKRVK